MQKVLLDAHEFAIDLEVKIYAHIRDDKAGIYSIEFGNLDDTLYATSWAGDLHDAMNLKKHALSHGASAYVTGNAAAVWEDYKALKTKTD